MKRIATGVLLLSLIISCGKPENVVNIYSTRHYEADKTILAQFEEQTGIKVNVVTAGADELVQRLETEKERTQADILITVDAGRMQRAAELGLLAPINDKTIRGSVPAYLADKDYHWVPLTKRARVIVYAKDRVNPEDIATYESLTHSKFKGKFLPRTSQNNYNQSLLASFLPEMGEEKAREWVEGVVANFAREPKGNDRDQVKDIAAGKGDLALVNTYYLGLMYNSSNEEERKVARSVGVVFPNQADRGTHINVSGVGITKHAKNKDAALKLVQYLLSKEIQTQLSSMTFEYPVRTDVEAPELLKSWGTFNEHTLGMSQLGNYYRSAVVLFDQSSWK